jgi:Domain of unknown function (DUF4184)
MPFTVSHVAAVLPLRRLNLVWSALVVGSMAPDFPYIIGTTEYRSLGHRLPGVIEFTVPASIFALWLFHAALKRPAASLLPSGMQQRLRDQPGPFHFGGPARFMAILFCLVLGIATHLVWDAFTHQSSWVWGHWVWLQGWVRVPLLGRMPMNMILQYGSTLIGLVALGCWVLLWYRKTAPQPMAGPARAGTWIALTMIAVATVIAFVRACLTIGMPKTLHTADAFLLVFGVTAIALVFWQVLIYCVMISSHQTW